MISRPPHCAPLHAGSDLLRSDWLMPSSGGSMHATRSMAAHACWSCAVVAFVGSLPTVWPNNPRPRVTMHARPLSKACCCGPSQAHGAWVPRTSLHCGHRPQRSSCSVPHLSQDTAHVLPFIHRVPAPPSCSCPLLNLFGILPNKLNRYQPCWAWSTWSTATAIRHARRCQSLWPGALGARPSGPSCHPPRLGAASPTRHTAHIRQFDG